MKTRSLRKMSILAMLAAAGIVLQVVESFFPITVLIPGYKLGLSNIAGLFALYAFGWKGMAAVTALRVFLAALATGSLFSPAFLLSFGGSAAACLVMALAKKSGWFSIYGVSTAGAAAHTFMQCALICWLYQQYFFELLLPVLTSLSVVSGLGTAWIAEKLLKRLSPLL